MGKIVFKILFTIVLVLTESAIIYWCWNAIAPIYFPMLPKIWQAIPYWNMFCLVYVLRAFSAVLRYPIPEIPK